MSIINKRWTIRFISLAVVLCLLITAIPVHAAQAAELVLPDGLKRIEEQAFYGDTSLDTVVIQNGTEVIASEAFAGSSVKTVTLPGSLYSIADNAFSGCENLTVNAQEGTYAYTWAVKNGYVQVPEVPTDSETKVVVATDIQAGANLEVQVFGPENTVSHTIYLINNSTKKSLLRSLRKKDGSVSWNGYELETGSYTVKVYTVTEDYGVLTPISKEITVSGTMPAGPEDIPVPDKIGWGDHEVSFEGYEKLLVHLQYYDADGNLLEEFDNSSDGNLYWVFDWGGATRLDVSFRAYNNGLWSALSSKKSIEIVQESYDPSKPDRPKLKNLIIPDNIVAGKDFEIGLECEDGISAYEVRVYDNNGRSVVHVYDDYYTAMNVLIPGVKLDVGTYELYVTIYDGEDWYTVFDQMINISGNRKAADVALTADKTTAYTNESVRLSIASNGFEAAYIKIVGDYTEYQGCYLQEDGNGVCTANLEVFDGTKTVDVEISACVFLGDRWSEWSNPVTVTVTRPEPLPTPVLNVRDNYENGEDIVVSVSNIDEADYYYVELREYYSGNTIISYNFYKNNPESHFGEDVTFSAAKFGSGSYSIRVRAYSYVRDSSRITKIVKVSGIREPASVVICNPDEFRINQTTVFSVDTTDCEQVFVRYSGGNDDGYWDNEHLIEPTGNLTNWSYKFDNYAVDTQFTFTFTVKKNGKWSANKVITKTVLGLPPLDSAVIHVDSSIETGKDFTITVDPVENATRYGYNIYRSNGGSFGYSSSAGVHQYYGYEFDPGVYTVKVWAYADDYAASSSEATFTITGTKTDAPSVYVDKDNVKVQESYMFTIDTEGAEMLSYRIGNNNGNRINVFEDETQWSTSSYSVGTYEYRFAVRRGGVWSAWSDPVTIAVSNYDPLSAPSITVNPPMENGKDLVVSLSAVEGATSYELYLQKTDGTVYFNPTLNPQNISGYTFPGYRITPGTYTVKAYARNAHAQSETVQKTITISDGDRPGAPNVRPPENTVIPTGYNAVFGIDTSGADMIAIRHFTVGNTNNIYYDTKIVTEGQDETVWSLYFSGGTRKYSFAVRKNGVWSEWSGFTAITAE